jgi:hypothetical protein
MKKIITIIGFVGALGLMAGIWTYQAARQLHWHTALVAGVYICIVSIGILLLACVLHGVDWIRKNVRIQ